MTRLITFLAIVVCFKFSAQTNTTHSTDEVKKTIEQFFDAMRDGDSTSLRRILAKDAVFFTTFISKEGKPVLLKDNPEEFIEAVGTPHEEIWDERISQLEIKIDGNLASAWMEYSFYINEIFSHCGVNAMQFFFDGTEWKLFEIADTRRKSDCEN